ncbi:hypothetical protein A3K29_00170 [Candidatus Collierbacteria bacterium RIFOXYB2_FULL_46_14]|nr:MAG: hypothetical protein A3K29_00170 [Candidatus Collierbacteria bacterium RIFOXYB2_FULL_46_14]OGD75595.1 MAG: hypothetical protein A3K43_00170 [Candidatus Collierbacteria bacterium RIFOXYA2_FULL_46_20]OGD76931.1 MAG: hypothetical protein A3K39_00170 [Candidatus Collierbacteria bacterium RIFOXYC2_FULL_43_15]OGD80222.1 MAG: hypothetical protein A2320_00660 [Pseudomonadales bacterium GWC2_63_15]OGD81653.1 MAG: hypothetical protein A3K36_00170 [Candidatus Collierbacteria bacterium RIFOXYD2_FUL
MKNSYGPSSFGLSKKLPNRHIKALWLIALLVIGLPLLAFAASLTTNLTPKAFTPTGQTICKEAVKTYKFEKPCTLPSISPSNTPSVTPTGIAGGGVNRAYYSITYTCIDGYQGTIDEKSCQSGNKLLTQVYAICGEHSRIKSLSYADPCRPTFTTPTVTVAPSPTTSGPQYYKTVNYVCADGYAGVYTSVCQNRRDLSDQVMGLCKNHSICPKPSATPTLTTTIIPTRTITPIPPITITDTVTSNVAPVITTTVLPAGNINSTYGGSVDAIDANQKDQLTMTMSGLPFGLSQGPCASLSTGGKITCYISGTPANTGIYTVKVNVKDNRGGSTDKSLTLSVYEGRPSPTPLFTPIVPPPIN